MKIILVFIFSIFLFGCNKSNKNEFTASFYTIRKVGAFNYQNSDTLVQETIFPKPKVHCYSLLNKNEKAVIDNFLNETDFENLDSIYTLEKLPDDAGGILFEIRTFETNKTIFMNSNSPKEFFEVIKILKKHSQIENLPIIAHQDFGNYRFVPPSPPKVSEIQSNGR